MKQWKCLSGLVTAEDFMITTAIQTADLHRKAEERAGDTMNLRIST